MKLQYKQSPQIYQADKGPICTGEGWVWVLFTRAGLYSEVPSLRRGHTQHLSKNTLFSQRE
jgi:hypothetical protein